MRCRKSTCSLTSINADSGIALTDVILTEVLQGIRSGRQLRMVEAGLAPFNVLRLRSRDDFRNAAALYRLARKQGITIRRTLDCLIAAVCIREAVPILHHDSDFDRLASCTDLQVHPS